MKQLSPLEVELVRLEVAGRLLMDAGFLIGKQLRLRAAAIVQRHIGLDLEDVG